MKSWVIGAIVLIFLGGGGWIYLTRAPSAPSNGLVTIDFVAKRGQ